MYKSMSLSLSTLVLVACSGSSVEEDDTLSSVLSQSSVFADVSLSLANLTVKEGKSNTLAFKLNNASEQDILFDLVLSREQGAPSDDLVVAPIQHKIPAGEKNYRITIEALEDNIYERNEFISVELQNLTGAALDNSINTTITIEDDDSIPVIVFDEPVYEISELVGAHDVPFTLSHPSAHPLEFEILVSGTASFGQDYSLPDTTFSVDFEPFQMTAFERVTIIEDLVREGGETLLFTISDSPETVYSLIILGDSFINDTGITQYSDSITPSLNFEPADYPGQDASVGYDRTDSAAFDGVAGFSFTKLDSAGNELPESAASFSCVRDNRSGLIYEIKDEFEDLTPLQWQWEEDPRSDRAHTSNYRAMNYQYTFITTDETNNGRSPGVPNDEIRGKTFDIDGYCAYRKEEKNRRYKLRCNTDVFLTEMNSYGHCGSRSWRMPTIEELRAVTYYAPSNATSGALHLDAYFFPKVNEAEYLSSTPSAEFDASVLCMHFGTGEAKLCHEGTLNYVMAVTEGD